jgi:hypothetical protein
MSMSIWLSFLLLLSFSYSGLHNVKDLLKLLYNRFGLVIVCSDMCFQFCTVRSLGNI